MSRTPEVIVSKPRKFFHDLFASLSGLAGIVALVSFLVGGSFIAALVLSLVCGGIAANIKFKLVKQVEVGGYKLV
jgi:hypothetical protein